MGRLVALLGDPVAFAALYGSAMAFDQPYAPVAFGFVTCITPGPNDMTPMASRADYGERRTVPHMLGVPIGFVVMAVLAGAGRWWRRGRGIWCWGR